MTSRKVSPSIHGCQPSFRRLGAIHQLTPPFTPELSPVAPSSFLLPSKREGGEQKSKGGESLGGEGEGEGEGEWRGKGFESVPEYYGRWRGSSWVYGEKVEKELRGMGAVGGLLGARAFEIGRCGQVVAVRRCECCGTDRVGSGTFREVKRTCSGRSCPYCAWVRATERVELLRWAAQEIPEIEGYEWQLLTLNPQYNGEKKHFDMSIEGLRARALGCAKMARECWKKLLKVKGGALLRCTEISEKGHIHVHMIYYGPKVDGVRLAELAAKACRRAVRSDVKKIKGGKSGVARAARYAAKGVKGSAAAFDEDYLTGEKSQALLHPKLAALWEIAAYNLRLSECYGALRGLSVPAPNEKGGPHDDQDVQCSCGATGRFRTVYRNVFDYLIECHLQGKAGIEGNKWLPYWMRENVRRKKIRERHKRRVSGISQQ